VSEEIAPEEDDDVDWSMPDIWWEADGFRHEYFIARRMTRLVRIEPWT
jgi:hypothetical protein